MTYSKVREMADACSFLIVESVTEIRDNYPKDEVEAFLLRTKVTAYLEKAEDLISDIYDYLVEISTKEGEDDHE